MPPKRAAERTRPRIGDVIEIETPRGLAYAHYTHEHREPPRWGSLLRVLPGFHDSRPEAFGELVLQDERFAVFFPLGAALRRGIFRIAANEPVPDQKQPFPVFRSRHVSTMGDAPAGPWWMWDGKREWRARQSEHGTPRALLQIWNDTLLVDRIAADWTPDDDPTFSDVPLDGSSS